MKLLQNSKWLGAGLMLVIIVTGLFMVMFSSVDKGLRRISGLETYTVTLDEGGAVEVEKLHLYNKAFWSYTSTGSESRLVRTGDILILDTGTVRQYDGTTWRNAGTYSPSGFKDLPNVHLLEGGEWIPAEYDESGGEWVERTEEVVAPPAVTASAAGTTPGTAADWIHYDDLPLVQIEGEDEDGQYRIIETRGDGSVIVEFDNNRNGIPDGYDIIKSGEVVETTRYDSYDYLLDDLAYSFLTDEERAIIDSVETDDRDYSYYTDPGVQEIISSSGIYSEASDRIFDLLEDIHVGNDYSESLAALQAMIDDGTITVGQYNDLLDILHFREDDKAEILGVYSPAASAPAASASAAAAPAATGTIPVTGPDGNPTTISLAGATYKKVGGVYYIYGPGGAYLGSTTVEPGSPEATPPGQTSGGIIINAKGEVVDISDPTDPEILGTSIGDGKFVKAGKVYSITDPTTVIGTGFEKYDNGGYSYKSTTGDKSVIYVDPDGGTHPADGDGEFTIDGVSGLTLVPDGSGSFYKREDGKRAYYLPREGKPTLRSTTRFDIRGDTIGFSTKEDGTTTYHLIDTDGTEIGDFVGRTTDPYGNVYYRDGDGNFYKLNSAGQFVDLNGDVHDSIGDIDDGDKITGWDYFTVAFGMGLDEATAIASGYSGLSLFYREDPLIEWTQDEWFNKLFGGIYGWSSAICSGVPAELAAYGAAFSEAPGGAYAHIEAENISITDYNQVPPSQYFLYKITFEVYPGPCNISFKVLKYEKGVAAPTSLFLNEDGVTDYVFRATSRNTTISYIGPDTFFEESNSIYTHFSIKFTNIRSGCLLGISQEDELKVSVLSGGSGSVPLGESLCDTPIGHLLLPCIIESIFGTEPEEEGPAEPEEVGEPVVSI